MKSVPRPPSAPPITTLRLSAIARRVSASGSLAVVLADLAYGSPNRDDVTALHLTSTARIANAAAVHS